MATKVKGDAIKEGSIPLSALATEVKDKIENAGGYEFLLDIGNNTEEHIANWVKICNDSRFYEYYEGTYPNYKGNCTLLIGASVIQFEYSVIEFDLSNIRVGGTIFYKYSDTEEFPRGNYIETNIATNDPTTITIDQCTFSTSGADWNAQEGEAGYIENKPFSKKHISKVLNDYIYDGDWEHVIHAAADGLESINVTDENIVFTSIGNYELTHPFYVPKILGDYTVRNKYGQQFTLGVVDYDNLLYVEIYGGDEDILHIEYDIVTFLSSTYIDDTVIKTTPQTLSDADKNQALANLGIDNTKYILSIAPNNDFDIQEFINKFGFVAEVNANSFGEYIGNLSITDNKELFIDKVLCYDLEDGLSKCMYVHNNTVSFMYQGNITNGHVVIFYAENDINSTPIMICWEPLG